MAEHVDPQTAAETEALLTGRFRPLTRDEIPDGMWARIKDDARAVADRLIADGWKTVEVDGVARWQKPESAPPAYTLEEWAEIRRFAHGS